MSNQNTIGLTKQRNATFLLLVLCLTLLAVYSLVQISVSQNVKNPFIQGEEATKDLQDAPQNYFRLQKKPKQKQDVKKVPKKLYTNRL